MRRFIHAGLFGATCWEYGKPRIWIVGEYSRVCAGYASVRLLPLADLSALIIIYVRRFTCDLLQPTYDLLYQDSASVFRRAV